MATPDVEMDEALKNVPVLAPDDNDTWGKVADLALRHIARVSCPPLHPDEVSLLPSSFPVKPLSVPASHAMIDQDAHIPAAIRIPKTFSIISYDIQRVCASFVRRPSDFYVGDRKVWACPKADCEFSIVLDDLSKDQRLQVERATIGVREPFVTLLDEERGACVPQYAREVIDILALRHYKKTHLGHLRIRLILHGQQHDGRIAYHWDYRDFGAELKRADARGWEARHWEEQCRLANQRALASEGRQWARDVRRSTTEKDQQQRLRTRREQGEHVRSHYRHLIKGHALDGLFDANNADDSQVEKIAAMTQVYRQAAQSHSLYAIAARERQAVCAAAEEQRQFWSAGEGSLRLEKRTISREMYL